MFIPNRCISRFLVNYRHFVTVDWNDNILSEITSTNAHVLAGTFSVKFALIWISTTEDLSFSFYLLTSNVKRE